MLLFCGLWFCLDGLFGGWFGLWVFYGVARALCLFMVGMSTLACLLDSRLIVLWVGYGCGACTYFCSLLVTDACAGGWLLVLLCLFLGC